MKTDLITEHDINGDKENVNVVLDNRWGAIVPKAYVEGVKMLLQEAIGLIRPEEPQQI